MATASAKPKEIAIHGQGPEKVEVLELGSTRSRLTGTKSPTIANSATPVRQLNTY